MKRILCMLAVLLFCGDLSFANVNPVDLTAYRLNPVANYLLVARGEAVAVDDLNGDGRNDVVITTGAKQLYPSEPDYEYHLFVYLQNDSGRLEWPIKYPAGNGRAVAIGDLNNDGRKDIAVSLLNGIGIYYQNSSGTWDPMVFYPSPHNVDMELVGLRIADLNHDGLPDVLCLFREAKIVEASKTYNVELLLQNQDGTLGFPTVIRVILSASANFNDDVPNFLAIETGDVNNDGLTDIIVTNTNDEESKNGFMVLLQNPDRTFGSPVYYDGAITSPVRGIAIGDVNGDGLADVVVTFVAGFTTVFLQNNQGTLDEGIMYASYPAADAVVITDVDNDGKQDVIVLHGVLDAVGYNAVGVYIQSNGGLMTEELFGSSGSYFNPQGMAVGDINGDGAKDVVFGDTMGLAIHYSNGPGPKIHSQSLLDFGSAVVGNPSHRPLFFFNAGISGLSVEKVAIQGRDASEFTITADPCSGHTIPPGESCQLDMAFLATASGLKNATLSIESNDPGRPVRTVHLRGEAVLSEKPVPPFTVRVVEYEVGNCGAESVAIGDVNGDGRADLVAASAYNCSYYDPENDNHLFVYLQNASGQLDPPIKYPAGRGWSIAIGDLNNDGRNDIVVTALGDIGVLYQNESGQLEPMRIYESGYDRIWRVRIGDFNHDGLLDVAATLDMEGRFIDVALFLQNQNGTLDPPIYYKALFDFYDVEVGDVNHDGLTDIIVSDMEDAAIYLQNEKGLLNMPLFRYMGIYGTGGTALGDINGDGLRDIVMPWNIVMEAGINIAVQNKEGTFDPVTWIYPSFPVPHYPTIGDVNGDGRQDLIVSHSGWGAIGVFLQDADGSLKDETLFYGFEAYSLLGEPLAVGDINGDGSDEIVFLHRGTGGYMAIFYHQKQNPIPKIVDFDGDQKTDIAVYHSASGLWFIKKSSDGAEYYVGYGGPDYQPVPGDYDGDAKTDIALYHSASGLWFIKKSSDGTSYSIGYGGTGYTPVSGDYDGDAKTDIAVYHAASGLWFVRKSSDGTSYSVPYGGAGYDPVPGDYDGDGRTDIAVYHSASGLWFIKKSLDGAEYNVGYGGPDYKPVPGDYDGDGNTDVAVYHSTSGLWFIQKSSDGTSSVGYGGTGYVPVPGDYDGEGKTDVAVYYSASGLWFIKQSSDGTEYSVGYGGSDYVPVNLDYLLGWVY